MSDDFRFLLARFPDPDWTERKLTQRLRDHLVRLRTARLERDQSDLASDETDPEERWDIFDDAVDINHAARERMERRVKRLAASPRAKGELTHLGRDELPRLEPLREPVRLIRLQTEHQADEIAAALHDAFPWMAEATCFFWQSIDLPPETSLVVM